MSNMAKLRNWYKEPTTGKLVGEVYHDHRFEDGSLIITTSVVTQDKIGDALIACTRNTHYELCHEDGAEWFTKPAAYRASVPGQSVQ